MSEFTINPYEVLEKAALRAQTKIKPANLRYSGAGRNFDRKVSLEIEEVKVDWWANPSLFLIEVRQPSPYVLAIGAPDDIVIARHLIGEIEGLRVYGLEGEKTPAGWLENQVNGKLLEALGLRSGERITIVQNLAAMISIPLDIEEMWERILILIAFTKHQALSLPREKRQTTTMIDASEIPVTIRALVPLIDHWAIPDDDLREEKIDQASVTDLGSLWARVSPLLNEIDKYLDVMEGKDSPEAAAVGKLAEAALEANMELRRRISS